MPNKTFRVTFSVADVYTVAVQATHKPHAIRQVKALHDRYGEDPRHGIHIADGAIHGWDAQEVAS